MKSMYVLRGIATIAVIVGHAIGWVYLGQSWVLAQGVSTGPMDLLNQVGSPGFHGLYAVIQLSYFAVPAFLFASGFFLSFVTNNGKNITRKMIGRWLQALAWPLILWLLIMVIVDWLPLALWSRKAVPKPLNSIVTALNLSYFVPLVAEFYLLSPVIARLARTNWKKLLLIAGGLHLAGIILNYVQIIDRPQMPVWIINSIVEYNDFFFWNWAIYFCLGAVIGFHFFQVKAWLERYLALPIAGVFLFGALSIAEMEFLSRFVDVLSPQKYSLSTVVYSISAIMVLLYAIDCWIPNKHLLTSIGTKSLGIYLAQVSVLVTVARLIYHTVPSLMFRPLIFFAILFTAAIGLPFLLGNLLLKYARGTLYPYFFG